MSERKKTHTKPIMNKNPKMKTPSIHHFLSPFHFININGIYTLHCLTFQA